MKVANLVETVNEARTLLKLLDIFIDEHQGEGIFDIGDTYSLIDVKLSLKDLISIIEESEIKTRIV